MQKSFIVENVEVDLINLTEKVKEEIEFRLYIPIIIENQLKNRFC